VLIPATTPDETITVERANGKVALRIGRGASRTAVLTAAEARRVARRWWWRRREGAEAMAPGSSGEEGCPRHCHRQFDGR
jgi:hypothetical protein